MTVRRIRERLLEARGLEKGTYGRLLKRDPLKIPKYGDRENKTALMQALEMLFRQDIDLLLDPSKSLQEVAKTLGLHEGTVSKWRLRRGLRAKKP